MGVYFVFVLNAVMITEIFLFSLNRVKAFSVFLYCHTDEENGVHEKLEGDTV